MGTAVELRAVVLDDAAELLALQQANRDFLAPGSPVRPADFYTLDGQAGRIRTALSAMARGELWSGVIESDRTVVGQLHLNNVLRGPLRSCFVGYWVDQRHNGQGVATRALAQALQVAFVDLGLHRVDAFARPENTGSIIVLERQGFERIGVARRHIHLAGRWRDEIFFQRLADWDDGESLEPPGAHRPTARLTTDGSAATVQQ